VSKKEVQQALPPLEQRQLFQIKEQEPPSRQRPQQATQAQEVELQPLEKKLQELV
jgi:hypothetical protein